ncbi:MAG: hypothetical protein R3F08_05750 [Dokdonella sp.]|nr:hypothetical protein [Dokdonella sp.]
MDEMKRFLKEQRDLERYLSDASKAIKAADSGLLEALKYSGSALEAASKRTLDELSATGIAKRYETSIKDIAVAANSLGQAQVDGLLVPHAELVDTIASLQSDGMFKHRMPLDHEVERLIDELQRSQCPAIGWLTGADTTSALMKDMQDIQSPWITESHAAVSAANFAAIHRVADLASSLDPFGTYAIDEIKKMLGDWSSIATSELADTTSALSREQLYRQHGFALDLSSFPLDAIDEIFARTGHGYGEVRSERDLEHTQEISARVNPVEEGGRESDVLAPHSELFANDEPATQRQRAMMFQALGHFEEHFRRFIVESMQRSFGEAWVDLVFVQNIVKGWRSRRETSLLAGRPAADLIAFCNFGDYSKIVGADVIYEAVFRHVFSSKSELLKSLANLAPIRIAIAHHHPITGTDFLVWKLETSRIRSALIKAGYAPPKP